MYNYMIGVIIMVHLGTITNAAGEDVTELVKSGQYALSDRANDYLNRVIRANCTKYDNAGDKAELDARIIA